MGIFPFAGQTNARIKQAALAVVKPHGARKAEIVDEHVSVPIPIEVTHGHSGETRQRELYSRLTETTRTVIVPKCRVSVLRLIQVRHHGIDIAIAVNIAQTNPAAVNGAVHL